MKVPDSQRFDVDEFTFLKETPELENNSVILRIAKSPLPDQAKKKLIAAFGEETAVITATNIIFSSDPSDDIVSAIDALEEQGYDVIAVDIAAPWFVKQEVVNSKDIKVPILGQELARDVDGDPIVIGRGKNNRDILEVLRYVELKSEEAK